MQRTLQRRGLHANEYDRAERENVIPVPHPAPASTDLEAWARQMREVQS